MVTPERRQIYLNRYQKALGIADWSVKFQKVSPWQVVNEKMRSNNNLVALKIENADKKEATIFHTRKRVTRNDIAHELVHLAHPDWQDHSMVIEETSRILYL